MMTPRLLSLAACAAALLSVPVSLVHADSARPPRPRILGVSHAAFYTSDLAAARAFYEGFLGFGEPYSIPRKHGGELVWIKINDRQTVELFPASEVAPGVDRLYHIALEVDDAEAMRVYLRAHGVEVPDKTPVGKIGNANFFIKDPDGHTVEIVQYLPQSWTRREQGKFLPDTRIAPRMSHVGIMVGKLGAAQAFYRDLLGFKEFWRGSSNGKKLSWVNMRVPDGEDYIEFMLYDEPPSLDRMHTLHHICLEVPNLDQVAATLAKRTLPPGLKPPTPMRAGVNHKRQINYYDPDGTRVEIMERDTIDGKPAPFSDAPPPR